MAGTPIVYVICDNNCKFEGMTKEQILTAIMQAVNEGTIGDIDAGFITTIKTINGQPLKFFYGDQSAYNALSDEEKNNVFAIITNDTTISGINKAIKELQDKIDEIPAGVAAVTSIDFPIGSLVIVDTQTAGMVAGENVFTTHEKTFYYATDLVGIEHCLTSYKKIDDIPKSNGETVGTVKSISGNFILLGMWTDCDDHYIQLWQKISD